MSQFFPLSFIVSIVPFVTATVPGVTVMAKWEMVVVLRLLL
jgi:hypothetical protein